jgi:pimeloyl-ACP methyl ester carboxylesterase
MLLIKDGAALSMRSSLGMIVQSSSPVSLRRANIFAASWFDHPRDLLHMVNHFRDQMPRPIIGVGHSMGGNNLVNLSLMHPRLLETLVLIDPVFAQFPSQKGNFGPAAASAIRRDRWPSRKAAAESFSRSKFYQAWDPRVLALWVKYGLRELPTKLYPDSQPSPAATGAAITMEPTITPNVTENYSEKEVTLTTTKHQEVFTFMRPNLPLGADSLPLSLTHPDIPSSGPTSPFYRPEPTITFHNIPFLRPSVFYIFGEHSDLSAAIFRDEKMANTGTGIGGSGGVKAGRVVDVIIKGTGHLIPMEKVEETGAYAAGWIGKEMKRWSENEQIIAQAWSKIGEVERYTLNKPTLQAFEAMNGKRQSKPKL